jgi:uncharacterized phage protein gp47/JayE
MAFTEKTTDQIEADYKAELTAQIPGVNTSSAAWPTKLGKILAFILAALYKVGTSILESHNVFKATGTDLDNIAAEHGFERKPATTATGTATFTGTNGTVVPSGSRIETVADADGNKVQFETTADSTVSSGTAVIAIEAVLAGEAGNVGAGTITVLTSPIAGITAVTNVAETTGGTDEEADGDEDSVDTATFRGRLIEDIKNPKNGGTEADFERWAREVTGVTQANALPLYRGAGTIDVVISEDYGVPSGGLVDDVQEYIDARRPVTADFEAIAATANALNVEYTITKKTGYSDAAVEANVEAAIEALRQSLTIGETLYLTALDNAVHDAAGVATYVRVAPVANITQTAIQVLTQGTYTLTVS